MRSESSAPQVIVQQWVSLDGFASGPDDEVAIMEAVDAESDAKSQAYNERFLADATAVMLGSRTYRQFVEYWPTATEPIAARVNETPKIIASSTLGEAPWGEFQPGTVVDDAVAYARNFHSSGSGMLVIWGSLDLVGRLIEADQVDQLDLFVAPVWLGEGTPLIAAGSSRRIHQVASEDWGSITHLRYAL